LKQRAGRGYNATGSAAIVRHRPRRDTLTPEGAGAMPADSPLILALVPDLWFLSRLRASAAEYGAVVESVRRAEHLAARAAAARPALVIVDIGTPGQDWAAAIRQLKQATATAAVPVVAFGPHVDHAGQAAARAAGADRVLSNRRFTEALPATLAGYLAAGQAGRGE
jgi:CheY-like chemotaxis protein